MTEVLPSAAEKPRFVVSMFARIAGRYDVMNTVMTLGMDAGWRRAVARAAQAPADGLVLDVGAGTGKLALTLVRAMGRGGVVGVDFTPPMMRAGRASLDATPAGRRVAFATADAQSLPFGDGRFHAVVSAFLVRNLADLPRGISEQVRVARPGGRVVVLEITPGPPGPSRRLFRFYFRRVVPLLGGLIAGDASAYTYLPESAAAFLEPERLADLLRAGGLVDVRVRRLGFGSVAIVSGTKPG